MINKNTFNSFLIYILLLLSFQTLSELLFEDETVHAASTKYDSYNLVPQTSKGLIESGLDIRKRTVLGENGQILSSTSTSTQVNGSSTIIGSRAYMIQYNNLDKILIVYDGAPSPSSALTKTNYTINGKPLDQKASIIYYEGNINPYASLQGGTNDINGFVLIRLAKDTIDKTGLYEIKVENISNRTGQIMLPVTKNVTLIDNTAPTLQKVRVIGSRQLEVTFDEPVTSLYYLMAGRNFTVKINGFYHVVNSVSQYTGAKSLVLTLSQDISYTAPILQAQIEVTTNNDLNGHMYITDHAAPANKIRENVKVTK